MLRRNAQADCDYACCNNKIAVLQTLVLEPADAIPLYLSVETQHLVVAFWLLCPRHGESFLTCLMGHCCWTRPSHRRNA